MRKINCKKWDVVRNWQSYLLGLPGILIFFLFSYLPLQGIVIAFKDFSMTDGGMWQSPWADPWYFNFEMFFTSSAFLQVTRNVFICNIVNLIFGTFFALFFSISLNEIYHAKVKKVYQSLLFLPFFLSIVVVARLVQMLTDFDKGLLNTFIEALGGQALHWTDMTWPWIFFLMLIGTWKGLGYSMVIYIASISGISEELYESAKIDGAGRMKMIMHITLPMLLPTILLTSLLNIGRIFYGDFQTVQAIIGTDHEMLTFTDNIETYIFRMTRLRQPPQYAMSTAVGLYQTLLGLIVILSTNKIVKCIDKDYALF